MVPGIRKRSLRSARRLIAPAIGIGTVTPLVLALALGLGWPAIVGGVIAVLAGALALQLIRLQRRALDMFFRGATASRAAMVAYDARNRLIHANDAYREVLGLQPGEMRRGMPYNEIVRLSLSRWLPAEEVEAELARRRAYQDESAGDTIDRRYARGRWVRITKSRMADGGSVGIAVDVTELYELRARLEREHARFSALAESAPIGIARVNAAGAITFANSTLTAMLDVCIDDPNEGDTIFELPVGSVRGVGALAEAVTEHKATEGIEVALRCGDGVRHFIAHSAVIVATDTIQAELIAEDAGAERILILIDVTERVAAEAEVRFLAQHDPLTGAYNRSVFAEALNACGAKGRSAALILIDLDRFKPVNDTYGHGCGDTMLQQLVERMMLRLDERTRLYRIGGDEFAVIAEGASRPDAIAIAETMVAAASEPFDIDGHTVTIGASAGLVVYPGEVATTDAALNAADAALYAAKRSGGDMVRPYDPAMQEELGDATVLQLGDRQRPR